MSRHVPVLTEVVVRAWGLDDPRVLPHLRAENQPGQRRRVAAVERRAKDAGWPVLLREDRIKAATANAQRLEGVGYEWNNSAQHSLFKLAALEGRSRRGEITVELDDPDRVAVSIFDE